MLDPVFRPLLLGSATISIIPTDIGIIDRIFTILGYCVMMGAYLAIYAKISEFSRFSILYPSKAKDPYYLGH